MDFESIYRDISPYTLVSRDRCAMLYRLSRYASALTGEMAEMGVYRGGTSLLLAKANPQKVMHSFDTFQGIPNATSAEDEHNNGDFSDVEDDVIKRLQNAGIKVHQGIFPWTAEGIEGPFCFAHFDGDTYQSCKDFLAYFWPRMVNGGIIMADDFGWHKCPGVRKAVVEHCNATGSWPFHTVPIQCAITVVKASNA